MGVVPVMITPFLPTGEIDWPCLDALVEWYVRNGVVGLFANCLSSEMFHLTNEERFAVVRRVQHVAAGRVRVVASGTFEGTVAEKAVFVNKMATIADSVVVIVCMMATKEEDDATWRANVAELLRLTPGVPLGLYECPVPYHRLLSADTLAWCAQQGRFTFHKDTCCDAAEIALKLHKLADLPGREFQFYNANAATVQFSLLKGGRGFSGICANFYPQLMVWLCANPTHTLATPLQDFLAVAENVVAAKYPTSAKAYLGLFAGFPISRKCRNQNFVFSFEENLKLESLHRLAADWGARLGLARLNPQTAQVDDFVPDSMGVAAL